MYSESILKGVTELTEIGYSNAVKDEYTNEILHCKDIHGNELLWNHRPHDIFHLRTITWLNSPINIIQLGSLDEAFTKFLINPMTCSGSIFMAPLSILYAALELNAHSTNHLLCISSDGFYKSLSYKLVRVLRRIITEFDLNIEKLIDIPLLKANTLFNSLSDSDLEWNPFSVFLSNYIRINLRVRTVAHDLAPPIRPELLYKYIMLVSNHANAIYRTNLSVKWYLSLYIDTKNIAFFAVLLYNLPWFAFKLQKVRGDFIEVYRPRLMLSSKVPSMINTFFDRIEDQAFKSIRLQGGIKLDFSHLIDPSTEQMKTIWESSCKKSKQCVIEVIHQLLTKVISLDIIPLLPKF